MTRLALSRNRPGERGVTIILVAVAMVFMIMALAAIAVDVVSLYTARSQASHAADAAAMAGAKTLANSGMTSDPTNANLQTTAQSLATQIATSVATQNKIGGQTVAAGQVSVSFPNTGQPSFVVNPQVSVTVRRTDLPTFFARAAGQSTVPVGSTSVAEAFNPSLSSTIGASGLPVPIAPQCVKPWILPNLDPTSANPTTTPLFDPSGAIHSAGMVGKALGMPAAFQLKPRCLTGGCTAAEYTPKAGRYYPAALTTPPPASSLPGSCGLGACWYEQAIAACSPQPIQCGVANNAAVDVGACSGNRFAETDNGTQCLIHGKIPPDIDQINLAGNPPPFATPLSQPMQFTAGANNPLVLSGALAAGSAITASDALVTIPVYDGAPLTPSGNTASVNVIGFIQGFIDPGSVNGAMTVYIVNMSGCGTGATATPVLGDGISPVPVHLISQ
jgi:Flp pilus assembly protein TadG